MTALEELNTRVSAAVIKAERLEDQGSSEVFQAFAEVSHLEEQLAGLLPATDLEGQVARRGAISAAIKANEFDRAFNLFGKYAVERSAFASECWKTLKASDDPRLRAFELAL